VARTRVSSRVQWGLPRPGLVRLLPRPAGAQNFAVLQAAAMACWSGSAAARQRYAGLDSQGAGRAQGSGQEMGEANAP
jgi:hypothetical protein